MREQNFNIHEFSSGLTLLGERLDYASSAALAILVPSGAAIDPPGQEGASLLLTELLQKGAGPFSNQQLSEQFEDIGVHRNQSAGIEVAIFSAAMLPENLSRTIDLFSHILLDPHLPEGELDNVRELALQDLEALEDEPASKVMNELAKRFYPEPFGRSQLGSKEGIEFATRDSLFSHYQNSFRSQSLLIAVAGNIDWEKIKEKVGSAFRAWTGQAKPLVVPALSRDSSVHHISQDTAQVQIALAFPSVSFESEHYYAARVAVGVLSGMAGRLFIEVREKRGLVYRVGASHSAARGRAAIFSFAGTTPENAQETADVVIRELRGLQAGITEEEINRVKVDLKTSLIMQSELPSVRASALVNDWWNLRRLRSLAEIKAEIEKVSKKDIQKYLSEYPISPITLVTLGSKNVELKS